MELSDGMVIGSVFGEALPPSHAAALEAAIHQLIDEFCEDVALLNSASDKIDETAMSQYLPRCYRGRYGPAFAKQFLMATGTVAWKLTQPEWHSLACIAEELGLNALVRKAETILEGRGQQADFGQFEDLAFEDLDFDVMFNQAWDGYAEETSLAFEYWFSAFRADRPPHPYFNSG